MPKPPEYMFACEFEKISPDRKVMCLPSGNKPAEDVFISGALTERSYGRMQKRVFMRVADATGVFIVSAPENSPVADRILSLKIPSFISVYGSLSPGYYEGSLSPLIVPYFAAEISPEVRDGLVRETAKRTLKRIQDSGRAVSGDIIPVLKSAEVMLGTVKEYPGPVNLQTSDSPGGSSYSASGQTSGAEVNSGREEIIISIIKAGSGKKGILMDELFEECRAAKIPDEKTKSILGKMLEEGDCYMPPGGYLKLL